MEALRATMVDVHLHGLSRGDHKFTVASMVSRRAGRTFSDLACGTGMPVSFAKSVVLRPPPAALLSGARRAENVALCVVVADLHALRPLHLDDVLPSARTRLVDQVHQRLRRCDKAHVISSPGCR